MILHSEMPQWRHLLYLLGMYYLWIMFTSAEAVSVSNTCTIVYIFILKSLSQRLISILAVLISGYVIFVVQKVMHIIKPKNGRGSLCFSLLNSKTFFLCWLSYFLCSLSYFVIYLVRQYTLLCADTSMKYYEW